jgi:hypothetical protein
VILVNSHEQAKAGSEQTNKETEKPGIHHLNKILGILLGGWYSSLSADLLVQRSV